MNLYKLNRTTLEEVNDVPFKLEKDIQTLVEENLETLFGLEFVKTEFLINNLRIDTLAFDPQTKSFVIIEYKKSKSYSVIDQGYSYLSLMLNNKADFILEYLEQSDKSLKKNDVEWSQSRVLFISPQFTIYQKQSIEFKDLPFELWEIKRYSNHTVILNQHKSTSQESVQTLATADKRVEEVGKEIKVYTGEEVLASASDEIAELFEEVKSRIMDLGEIEINPTKVYIGFKVKGKTFTDFDFSKKHIKQRVNLKKGMLDDPKNLFEDVSEKGHWGVGDYMAKYGSEVDLDYLMTQVKQAYKHHSGERVLGA